MFAAVFLPKPIFASRHLKDAYFCGGAPSCLGSADTTAKDLQDEGALYLRSDDEQRTVMSGQVRKGTREDKRQEGRLGEKDETRQ